MCVCLRTRERAAAPGAQGFAQPPPRLSELAGGRLIIYRVSPKSALSIGRGSPKPRYLAGGRVRSSRYLPGGLSEAACYLRCLSAIWG